MGVKLRERPGKGWYVLTDWKGQRAAKFFGQDKKAAKSFVEKLTARLKWAEQSGEPIALSQPDQAMPTVKAYLEDWLSTYAKVHCKPSTYRGYQRAVEKHLLPAFGHRPLHTLRREDVKRFIAEKAQDRIGGSKQDQDKDKAKRKARWTIQGYLVPLKAAYNQAIEDGLVTMNPVARLGRLLQTQRERRAHIQPLTPQEVETLLEKADAMERAAAPLLLCAVRTGLRMGELIGLQWGDVDVHGAFLEVRRAVVLGAVTSTKSHKIRRVDLGERILADLRRLKEIRKLEAMASGQEMRPWVFLSPEGQRWDERNLRRMWYRLLEKAELRRVRFHDLRHTYASQMAANGAPPKYVQEQLGHSSIQVTMDIYSHLFPNGNREWVKKLDEPVKQAPAEAESATQAQPVGVRVEQGSHKLAEGLVAVEGIEPPTRGL